MGVGSMALPIAAAVAGTTAVAAYLDAKYLIRHDLSTGNLAGSAAAAVQYLTEKTIQDRLLVYHNIEDHAHANKPNHLFLEYQGRSWTYKQFYADLQRVGNWLMKDLGIQKGEIVAIDGPNSPEYLMLWFALDGIGAVPSFVNCNLTGQPLLHCVKLCDSRYLIAEREIQNLVEPIRDDLEKANTGVLYYDQLFLESLADATPLPRERTKGIKPDDLRSLIYTSGTTGLPKGTMMLTGRDLNTGRSIADYLKLKPSDKIFTCLPLYHGAAHGLCITPIIHAGAAVTLSRKFSHKTFWPEVSASGANILQYVGELCRYLTNAPEHSMERKHTLEMAWGNGMRPDVWEVFRQRFNIPVINELYAATDGLGATFNANKGDFGKNAIAMRGAIWHLRNGKNEVRVRMDVDTEEIMRDENGFAIPVEVNEPGEVLHKVDEAMMESAFKGYYKNKTASDKRWMRNVFQKGDVWFRSGDVMRIDKDGCLFFVDRLGDTFRWKSENVSTNEVADVLGQFDQIHEANVYGVSVPRNDGRCGCAAIVMADGITEDTFDFAGLAGHVLRALPRYAVPVFLRTTNALSYTGTFKIQKGQAKREGVDLDLIEQGGSKDKVYWLPADGKRYVPFERKDWESLKAGQNLEYSSFSRSLIRPIDSWMGLEFPSTIRVASEFLRQLNQWYECLPNPVRFGETESGQIPREELPYILRTRMLEIRSWILRPFLFYAVHALPQDMHQAVLKPLVDQSLHASVRLIEANSLRHRHHGTWYMLRLSITSALSIFAAAKRGLAPESWQSSLELAIETLLYWEREAPGDIRKGRLALENLLSDFSDCEVGCLNLSGCLPYTVARNLSDYAQPSIVTTAQRHLSRLPTLRAPKHPPRYWFGHGLSYANFHYTALTVSTTTALATTLAALTTPGGDSTLFDVAAIATVSISSSGEYDGADVVQLYLAMLPTAGNPTKILRGFEYVAVRVGAEQTRRFYLTRKDISYWDVTAQAWTTPGGTYGVHVGAGDIRLTATFEM